MLSSLVEQSSELRILDLRENSISAAGMSDGSFTDFLLIFSETKCTFTMFVVCLCQE